MADPSRPIPDYGALIAELHDLASIYDAGDDEHVIAQNAIHAVVALRRQVATLTDAALDHRKTASEALAERDAAREESARLAAVIEKVRDRINSDSEVDPDDGIINWDEPNTTLDHLVDILDFAPADILATHDARVKAEALMDARHLVIGTPGFDLLTARAAELRGWES